MKVSQLIDYLEKIKADHGDIVIYNHYGYSGMTTELCDEDIELRKDDNFYIWINPWRLGT